MKKRKLISAKKILQPKTLKGSGPSIPLKNLVLFAFVLNLVIIFGILSLLKWLPPQIPLFYGLAEGEEQLAPAFMLILPSVMSCLIIILNLILASLVKSDILKKFLVAAAITSSLFSITTTIKIIVLVGSF